MLGLSSSEHFWESWKASLTQTALAARSMWGILALRHKAKGHGDIRGSLLRLLIAQRPHSSSRLGLPYRILHMNLEGN